MSAVREKISLTLPPDLVRRARAAHPDLSDFAAQAMWEKLLSDAMAEYRRIRALETDVAADFWLAAEEDAS
ncbi:hypothetical protein [Streptomyces sp. NPDC002640]